MASQKSSGFAQPKAFNINLTSQARENLAELAKHNQAKAKKAGRAIEKLGQHGPEYPGLRTHKLQSIEGPYGEAWQSYVENNTPGAWRIFWCYGPQEKTITVFLIRKHL